MYAYASHNDSKFLNFTGLSAVGHLALFALAMVLKITQPVESKLIEIEILPPQGVQQQVPLITEKPIVQVQKPVVHIPKVSKTTKATIRVAKLPKALARSTIKAPVARIHALPPVEMPNLETPDLETPTDIQADNLPDDSLNDDFAKVDRDSNKQLEAAAKALQREQKQALLAHQDSLSEVEAETAKQAARMAARAKAQHAQEMAQAQASAEAAGRAAAKAAAEAAARAEAERSAALTAEKAAAAAALADAKLAEMNAKANSETDNQASAQADSYGSVNGVRSLDQLKQMPGNRKPQYDSDDRLQRRQGQIIIVAYVSKEGIPTQFKLVRGTGFRSLDLKTFQALKKWKFYPGQEGWVEIPFKWDLKGGPQEMPATLRRQISRN